MPIPRSIHVIAGLAATLLGALAVTEAQPSPEAPVVYSAEVDSVIHPVSAEFILRTLDEADRSHAALVVLTLRTPGGLVDSTRDIITGMIAADTPVAVWVGPSGSRAASAGFLLTIAADVAAMAPGTHIGAAHPVAGGGEKMDETMAKKSAEDVAAYARTLASGRGRNVELAADAVMNSRAFTETEALNASPPLIDLVAPDIPALLSRLDGRTIRRFDGTATVLHTRGARVIPVEMSLRQRILSAVAHPNVAYLLLSLGMLGLTIELWSPGAILPGVVGGLSLLLAFFALQLLPVNFAGVLLILLGLLLFALEIKITSYGLLSIGGIVSLLFGSLMLTDAGAPELRVSLGVVIPVVAALSIIATLLVRLAVAAQRQQAQTGAAGMVGREARTLTAVEPDRAGQVDVHGEIWQAQSNEHIPQGARVRILSIDGLTLTVRRE
ncbi:MAG: nodulation protein NfeD [Vicinamibacterales bacterium]